VIDILLVDMMENYASKFANLAKARIDSPGAFEIETD
jgi:hypothetical protein